MNLPTLKDMKSEKGFTIVELLIVIVIIGILAAIVIVAYTGITTRANDSNSKANAVSIQKVGEAVNAESGSYPWGSTTATLTTAFNSAPSTILPSGVTLSYISSATAAPSYATVLANAGSNIYTVKVCTAASPNATGNTIYYPIRATSTVGTATIGTGC